MENENALNENVENEDTDYVDIVKNLKENSVDKAKYDSLKAENKKLLEALASGQQIDTGTEDELGSREEYLKAYKNNKFANDLEYWENFLNLRKATIAEYGKDPCVTGNYGLTPEGDRVEPAYGEEEAIQEAMDTIEGFIEEAQGDAAIFSTLMQSALKRK